MKSIPVTENMRELGIYGGIACGPRSEEEVNRMLAVVVPLLRHQQRNTLKGTVCKNGSRRRKVRIIGS